ncbi:MAG TPA: hypothetical protein VGQ05_03400 [Streptosporangiaceae bacterium]|jgi:hypothetical protein|nr:hypothetical protein [Streptosporangiaceae bacterium]
MRRDRAGSAIAARDAGLRRVTRLTWQVTAAGAAGAALIAAAFGHGVSQQNASQRSATQHRTTQHGTSNTGPAQRSGHRHPKHSGSSLIIPNQPPAPANGAGQVTSGGS